MCSILDQKAASGRQLHGTNLKVHFTAQVIAILSNAGELNLTYFECTCSQIKFHPIKFCQLLILCVEFGASVRVIS